MEIAFLTLEIRETKVKFIDFKILVKKKKSLTATQIILLTMF